MIHASKGEVCAAIKQNVAKVFQVSCSCGKVLHVRNGLAVCTHEEQMRIGGEWVTHRKVVRHFVSVASDITAVFEKQAALAPAVSEHTISEREGLR